MVSPNTTPLPLSTPAQSSYEELQQQIAMHQQQLATLQTAPAAEPLHSVVSVSPKVSKSSLFDTPPPVIIKVAPPEPYDGTLSKAETFLSQLLLYFHGRGITDDLSRVVSALSIMKGGTAGQWAKVQILRMEIRTEMQFSGKIFWMHLGQPLETQILQPQLDTK
ncbi:hypothetical protein CVT25_002001 [Psilocybe cyanescens]|uniref:Uncharacterized protein n=1 Tax=Psilocybe cyanescens TaxID=93625 RepID=A0A409XYL0_PSICY|nr:hypothetical protein CVT25_002001 [Psilocybe cyanescens]